jgi:stage II sporulation protein D
MRRYRLPFVVLAAAGTGWAWGISDGNPLGDYDAAVALYSPRFSFTDDHLPLLTVEIMSGQPEVVVSAEQGVTVSPDDEFTSEIGGHRSWRIRAEKTAPAVVREWVVVERLAIDDEAGAQGAMARWQRRGLAPRRFEIGVVFAVEGEVIDGRELLVAVAPGQPGQGAARARELAARWNVATSLHEELVTPPSGILVATGDDGRTIARNPRVLWFAPAVAAAPLRIDDVVFGGGGSQLRAEQREHRTYWGQLYVTIDRNGALAVVNAVTADKLLAGLVPAEIFPEAPDAALAAQAIAARTELLSRIGTRHLADPYLLCSNQHCQVYSGAGREHPRTTAAVQRTRGQVLVRDRGGLVDARYSASCGGHGEDNETIWHGAPDPSLRGRVDSRPASPLAQFEAVTNASIAAFLASDPTHAYCGGHRYARGRYRWTKQVSVEELTQRVASQHPQVGRLRALHILQRSRAGRVIRLELRGSDGSAVVEGDLYIRRLLSGLKSTLFAVRVLGPADNPTFFVFEGAGFGHGVGMCQTGAIGRALAGSNHDAILRHYYPGSHTHRLY